MTTREYFQTVLEANISEEMNNASRDLLTKLDARNEKRKSADTKQKKETAARREAVKVFLSAHPGEAFTRDAIAEATGLTPAAVSSAMKPLTETKCVTKSEVKAGKSKKVAYTFNAEEAGE